MKTTITVEPCAFVFRSLPLGRESRPGWRVDGFGGVWGFPVWGFRISVGGTSYVTYVTQDILGFRV